MRSPVSPELLIFMWGYLTGAVTIWMFGLIALIVRYLISKGDDNE